MICPRSWANHNEGPAEADFHPVSKGREGEGAGEVAHV